LFNRSFFEPHQSHRLSRVAGPAIFTPCLALPPTCCPQKLAGASLLIFANKQDLAGALSLADISAVLGLDKLVLNRHCHIQACSAVTGAGLVEGVEWLVSDIASRIFMLE
jgi:hypothetical protein